MGKTEDLLKKAEEQRKNKYSLAIEKSSAQNKPPQEKQNINIAALQSKETPKQKEFPRQQEPPAPKQQQEFPKQQEPPRQQQQEIPKQQEPPKQPEAPRTILEFPKIKPASQENLDKKEVKESKVLITPPPEKRIELPVSQAIKEEMGPKIQQKEPVRERIQERTKIERPIRKPAITPSGKDNLALKLTIGFSALLVITILTAAALFFSIKNSNIQASNVITKIDSVEKLLEANKNFIASQSQQIKELNSNIDGTNLKIQQNQETISKLEEKDSAFDLRLDTFRKAKDQLFKRVSDLEAEAELSKSSPQPTVDRP